MNLLFTCCALWLRRSGLVSLREVGLDKHIFFKCPISASCKSLYNDSIKAQRNQGRFFSLSVNLQRVEHSITSLKIYGKCSSFLLSLNITAVSMNFTAVLPATVSSNQKLHPHLLWWQNWRLEFSFWTVYFLQQLIKQWPLAVVLWQPLY